MSPAEVKQVLKVRLDVSRETLERLEALADLLEKWTARINLVSKSSLPEIWTRHILDSAQIWPHRKTETLIWADLGSGGGFPGLVVAAIAADEDPDMRVRLIESDARKGVFLSTATRNLGLNAEIVTSRIETASESGAETVSARALAPMSQLLGYAERHMTLGGTALFLKGRTYESELTDARKSWEYKAETIPSLTDPDAVLLKIGDLSRV
jgi:16S rRNA (guanine527-N7)-methyltransferase